LKGILLFHRESTKDLSHDLRKSLARVKKISKIDLKLESEIEQFIEVLNFKGPNRYFEWNSNRNGFELLLLDKTVWNLRIHCVPLNSSVKQFDKGQGKVIWTSQEHFEKINKYQPGQSPHDFSIPYAMLEEILAGKSEARQGLVWKNFYFGNKLKQTIKWKAGARYSSPAHVITPEIFSELAKLVKFSPPVLEYFRSLGQTKSAKMPAAFFQLKVVAPVDSVTRPAGTTGN
jgi:hypothetical protein